MTRALAIARPLLAVWGLVALLRLALPWWLVALATTVCVTLAWAEFEGVFDGWDATKGAGE